MGQFADMIAGEYQFTREQQDAYALETLARAIRATEQGDFKREITPVTIKDRKGETVSIIKIATDITDQRRAEEERRRLEARGLEVHARHDVVLGAGGGDRFERLDV